MAKRLLLLDVDGVLADCSHRLHFREEKDYDSFYSADEILKDTPIAKGKQLMEELKYGYTTTYTTYLVTLTGRPERTRLATKAWMEINGLFSASNPMLMRRDGDYRPSDVIKLEAVDGYMKEQWEDKNRDLGKFKLNRFNKKPIGERRREYAKMFDSIAYIDDDPKNVKAIGEAYPEITALVFGTDRF